MISIIICSSNNRISNELEENIKKTIGTDYELITIDNSKNEYSIFSAYNSGIQLSKYPFLCFMHEDILFHTHNWGNKVIEHFEDSYLGIIGVAGSYYIPKMPCSWWSSGISTIYVPHTATGETNIDHWDYLGLGEQSRNVVILDGLWLCTTRKIIQNVFFDETTFKGFHCYDSDICMQIFRRNHKVRVVHNIKIEHFSYGKRDKEWIRSIFKFYNKWKNYLPTSTLELSKTMVSNANYINARTILEEIKTNKPGLIFTIKTWFYYLNSNPLVNKKNWILLLVLIKKICFPEPLKSWKILNIKT